MSQQDGRRGYQTLRGTEDGPRQPGRSADAAEPLAYGTTSQVHVQTTAHTEVRHGSTKAQGPPEPEMGWLSTTSVNFSEIVREQYGTESIEETKRLHQLVYQYTRDFFYKFLVLLTGFTVAFAWGLAFGACSYVVNWWLGPVVRLSKVCTYSVGVLLRAIIRGACSPFYASMDFVWKSMTFKFSSKTTESTASAVLTSDSPVPP